MGAIYGKRTLQTLIDFRYATTAQPKELSYDQFYNWPSCNKVCSAVT